MNKIQRESIVHCQKSLMVLGEEGGKVMVMYVVMKPSRDFSLGIILCSAGICANIPNEISPAASALLV